MSHIAIPLCRITFMLEKLNRNFAKQKCIKFVYIDGFVFVKLVITAVFYMSRIIRSSMPWNLQNKRSLGSFCYLSYERGGINVPP